MADFERAVSFVLRVEGGYVNDPDDPGGETKYGISKRAYPNEDIANLTIERAKEIYRRDYWDRADCASVPWPMCLLVFDTAVNSGVSRATRWLRKHRDFNSYLAERLRFYTSLGTWSAFGRGWVNRMAELIREASKEPGEVDVVVLNYPLHRRILDAIKGRLERRTAWRIRVMTAKNGLKLDLAQAKEEGE